LPGLRLWLRYRWLSFILLGLVSMVYAFSLVRGADTINRVGFYWFFYSGALLIVGGLVEQGNNLERRAD
jgi:predicted membrane channel-forming protein YqfA (hemolysin III family)